MIKISSILLVLNIPFLCSYSQSDSLKNGSQAIRPYSLYAAPTQSCQEFGNRPVKWGFIRNIPDNLKKITLTPLHNNNWKGLSAVTALTALLIWKDQVITDNTKQFAKKIHLRAETDYTILIRLGNTKILKIPNNLNTAFYQVGEGATGMFIAGGLYIYGKANHDNRALQTASDLTETFLTMGLVTQILKRTTGRQSPFMATKPGGKWQPFPSFSDYQSNTSNYDAFPSGHLASLMATLTVLTENYPEKKWIKPLGYSIILLSCFAMINTDVHWAGDYPLSIAIGYISGKITTARHKQKTAIKHIF